MISACWEVCSKTRKSHLIQICKLPYASRLVGPSPIDSFPITWWLWKPVQLDGRLDRLHFDTLDLWTMKKWGLCVLRHGFQISVEAILACHPARSTEWLDCHPKSCERWRIRTGPIVHAPALRLIMIPWYPEVSKYNQSRWPSNCTCFHGHHVMRNSCISYLFRICKLPYASRAGAILECGHAKTSTIAHSVRDSFLTWHCTALLVHKNCSSAPSLISNECEIEKATFNDYLVISVQITPHWGLYWKKRKAEDIVKVLLELDQCVLFAVQVCMSSWQGQKGQKRSSIDLTLSFAGSFWLQRPYGEGGCLLYFSPLPLPPKIIPVLAWGLGLINHHQ